MPASPTATSPPSQPAPVAFSALPDDVLRDHILTLLDGPTLASLSCVSRHLRSLIVTPSTLWSHICGVTWPSTLSPLLRPVIASFPADDPHLSFFSRSYPVIASDPSRPCPSRTRRLISAVDLRYQGDLVFTRAAEETETSSSWFLLSPFRIDLLEQKEVVPTPIPYPDKCQSVGEDLTLSWIVVDPDRKRAANLSSHKAVTVERHWLSGEMHARFSSVTGGEMGTARELVEFVVAVTLGDTQCRKMEVREVSMRAEDMDGVSLNGEDSLRILERGGFEGKRRGGKRRESAARERYEEFMGRKEERKETKARMEGRLDCFCVWFGLAAAVGIFFFFSSS